MKHFNRADFEACGSTVLDVLSQYVPGRQHGLMKLIRRVMRAFVYEFPAKVKGRDKEKIKEIESAENLHFD